MPLISKSSLSIVWLKDNLPTFWVPTLTVEAEALAGTIEVICVNTFSPITFTPVPSAIITSVCDLPNWSKPVIVYFSPTSDPAGVIVITWGFITIWVACVPTFIVLAVLLAADIDKISLKEILPVAVAPFTPVIVSDWYTPDKSYPLTTKELLVSLPLHKIVTFPLRALEFFRAPSRIKFPAVEDLVVKILSSSVVERTPLELIATPADIFELKIESSSVIPDVSFQESVILVGGEPLTAEPALL